MEAKRIEVGKGHQQISGVVIVHVDEFDVPDLALQRRDNKRQPRLKVCQDIEVAREDVCNERRTWVDVPVAGMPSCVNSSTAIP
ncbi:MAG: hypothetical protein AAFY46_00930, partial [Planctomycetota bacterium]